MQGEIKRASRDTFDCHCWRFSVRDVPLPFCVAPRPFGLCNDYGGDCAFAGISNWKQKMSESETCGLLPSGRSSTKRKTLSCDVTRVKGVDDCVGMP